MRCCLDHKFFRIRRTWVDVSSSKSRCAGYLFYRPGRAILRIASWLMVCFAWIPWPYLLRSRLRSFDSLLPGFDPESVVGRLEYLTVYVGNGSARSKYTLEGHREDGTNVIIKVGMSKGAFEAIDQEAITLEKLAGSVLKDQVPRLLGVGTFFRWRWSAQTAIPIGRSPLKLQQEHEEFLLQLKKIGLSHGDFTPWNCSIVNGKLYVYDWEEAGPYEEGFDRMWFKKQVRDMLGVG